MLSRPCGGQGLLVACRADSGSGPDDGVIKGCRNAQN
jgi:hypothetical protein